MFEEKDPMFLSRRLLQMPMCRLVQRIPFATAALLCFSILTGRAQAQEHPMEELRKLNESVDALVRKVSPSVVQILVSGYGPLEESDRSNTGVVIGRQRAIGSGFIIDPSGYIITNAHVVKGAERVQVVLSSANSDDHADATLPTKT